MIRWCLAAFLLAGCTTTTFTVTQTGVEVGNCPTCPVEFRVDLDLAQRVQWQFSASERIHFEIIQANDYTPRTWESKNVVSDRGAFTAPTTGTYVIRWTNTNPDVAHLNYKIVSDAPFQA